MRKKILARKNLNNEQIKSYSKAVEKGMKSQHVVPTNGNWAVKRVGAVRASRVFDTQKEAIQYGQKIAQNKKSELFVHSLSGRIKSRQAY